MILWMARLRTTRTDLDAGPADGTKVIGQHGARSADLHTTFGRYPRLPAPVTHGARMRTPCGRFATAAVW
ncbi:hypothetical protein Afe04nite_50190 [Asanoa ferruginea]|nr:hypothetical protein Afe04nite_50190 [Asanoa ferruginea]